MSPESASCPLLLLSADREVRDQVSTAAAALDADLVVRGEPEAASDLWVGAGLVLVGADAAPATVAAGLPRRTGVMVVASEAAADQACVWSAPLRASVVLLPSGTDALVAALTDAMGPRKGAGRLVAVLGGSGGVGTSTWATALAFTAAREGWTALLVDADPLGGGLDVLAGAEGVPGWRWPELAAVRGHLGPLVGRLPAVEGVDLLSMGRARRAGRPGGVPLRAEQLASVLGSASRSHDLTVVDLPRWQPAIAEELRRRADQLVLVVRADVRGVAAARELTADLDPEHTLLVLRRPRGSPVSAAQVGEVFGVEVLGSVPDDPAVRSAGDRGDPPGRGGRGPTSAGCRELLLRLSVAGRAA